MAMHGRRGPGALAGEREKRSRPMGVLLKRLVGYLGKFKRIVAIGAVFSLLGTIFTVFDPLVLTWGIDEVFSATGTIQSLLFLTSLYAVLKIASWVLNGINVWILTGAQAGMVQTVQEDVYSHLVNADISYHKSAQSGNVTSRVTSDTESLATGIQVLIDFSSRILLLVSTFLLLWFVSPSLALTVLVVVPGVILLVVLFGTVGQRIMLASQRAYGKVSGQIAESLGGIQIAKAFNREEELSEQLSDLNEKAYHHGFRFMILMSAMQPLVRSIGLFGMAAVLFVGGTLAVGTLPVLTIGEVFLGIVLVNRFMWPLLALSMMTTQVQASLAAMDRISDVLEAERSVDDSPDALPLREESDGIYFKDMTFEYVEETPVLIDVDLEIPPGKTVAIVGHTGAGKTTLAALINRFYDPQEGQILIGNQDIRSIEIESLHDEISLIPQEPYLFDGTVIENIRYGKPDASDEEIVGLCKLIGAHDFIDVLANGYQSMVYESGKNLSAGQRQMITIARTMLADPKILILDEATSRLDAYSESLVQEAQALLFKDRTTVVIAHRLTTIANADKIVMFENGRIIEEGTHEELLALGGKFKSLYDTYYAHQGVEEITEEVASVAGEQVSKLEASGSQDLASILPMGPDGQPDFQKIRKLMEEGKLPPEVVEAIQQRMRARK